MVRVVVSEYRVLINRGQTNGKPCESVGGLGKIASRGLNLGPDFKPHQNQMGKLQQSTTTFLAAPRTLSPKPLSLKVLNLLPYPKLESYKHCNIGALIL